VHPASPGRALEDLDQFPCAGPASAAFFVARAGQSVPRHARSPRTRGSAETRLPACAVRGDRQAVACHARQRLGGPVALFPRVGLGGWDLSRCPLARVRRSTSFGLLRATSGEAQAAPSHPGTHREHAVVCRGRVNRDSFSLFVDGRGRGRAANGLSPSQARSVGALWCLPRAAPPRAVCVRATRRRRRGARLRTPLPRRL